MLTFIDFRKLRALGDKRHPMFENNRIAKGVMYIAAIFWVGYFIFFGTFFGLMLETNSMEGYHLLNSALIVIFALDFLMRLPLQKLPTQDIKPFMLLPIPLKRITNYMMLNSSLNGLNLFWMFFFVPFAIITLPKFFGMAGVLLYCLGIWLLILCNNYWYLICKMLISRNAWWTLLPIVYYTGIFFAVYSPMLFEMGIPKRGFFFYLFVNLGEGLIMGNIGSFAIVLALLAITWTGARTLLLKDIREEVYKIKNARPGKERISEYKFFERFGEIGEYMRLETKLMLRNKVCKTNLYTASAAVILFSILLSVTEIYDGPGMRTFILIYDFMVFGMTFLGSVMSYEGNYIDGLMSRKESIYVLLRAKYLIGCIGTIIPFVLLIPAMIAGKVMVMDAVSWCLFTMGPIYLGLMQTAVFNKSTIPLNQKVTKHVNNGTQTLVSFAVLFVPTTLYIVCQFFMEQDTLNVVWSVSGLLVILTSNLWLKHIYTRLMQRKHTNLEGFRDSRQKNQ